MLAFFTALAGLAVGTVLAPTLTRLVTRFHERGELTRDALVDLNSLITALEEALPLLAKSVSLEQPGGAEDLVDTPSGFSIPGPMIPLTRYLSCLDDEELHRLFMLIFHDHHHLAEESKDAAKAFDWLIANDAAWETPLGRECRSVLKTARVEALECVRRLLRRCSEACAVMAHDPPMALFRSNRPSIGEFVLKHYKLNESDVEFRAAFYRRLGVGKRFDRHASYGLYKWTGTDVTDNGITFVRIVIGNGEVIDALPGEAVALPVGASIGSLMLSEDNGTSWRELDTRRLGSIPRGEHGRCVCLKLPAAESVRLLTD